MTWWKPKTLIQELCVAIPPLSALTLASYAATGSEHVAFTGGGLMMGLWFAALWADLRGDA